MYQNWSWTSFPLGETIFPRGEEISFQAKWCSRETLLIELDKTSTFAMTPSCTARFLENHIRSQETKAYIWKRWTLVFGMPTTKQGLKIQFNQSDILKLDQTKESRGQKESLQVPPNNLAKLHRKKLWLTESTSILQRGQTISEWGI